MNMPSGGNNSGQFTRVAVVRTCRPHKPEDGSSSRSVYRSGGRRCKATDRRVNRGSPRSGWARRFAEPIREPGFPWWRRWG